MKDSDDQPRRTQTMQPLEYARPYRREAPGDILHALSVMAGIVSVLGLLAWGWAQYISKIGPMGFLALPFFPIAIAGISTCFVAFHRGRRIGAGILLNGSAMLLFFCTRHSTAISFG